MEERGTIAAQITPEGIGAVSVIRVSGEGAIPVIQKLTGISSFKHHRIYITDIKKDDGYADKAVISVFLSPNSYTGEDVVEISVHGGKKSSARILDFLSQNGVRSAERGEFTKRAFLNGKLDLIQAESVLNVINARTDGSLRESVNAVSGELSGKIAGLRDIFLDMKSLLDGSVDFPEDMPVNTDELKKLLDKAKSELMRLSKSADSGLAFNSGVKVLITGKANTGKSTLFNRMVESERAIVTDEPGTTRDLISEWIDVNGLPVLLFDSAGIRTANSTAESLGIEKVRTFFEKVDLIIMLLDISKESDEDDLMILNEVKKYKLAVVGNMKDKADKSGAACTMERDADISAKNDKNTVEIINRVILDKLKIGFESDYSVVTRRQKDAVNNMASYMAKLDMKTVAENPEIASEIVSEAISEARCLIGEIYTEDVLENIFSKFCIGK